MKKLNYFLMLALFGAGFLLFSCSDDDDDTDDKTDDDKVTTITLTQAMLDGATTSMKLDINTGAMAHNGNPDMDGTTTYRDVYSNMSDASKDAVAGDIITKRVFMKDADGNKMAKAGVTFAMVKHEDGYDDANGNWEWVKMPGNPPADMPNGNLSSTMTVQGNASSELASCATCHKGSTKDYRFVFP